MFLEVVGLARSQMMLVVLPWPVSSGVGGLGRWTGLEIGALAIPDLEPVRLTVIGLPIASVVLVLLLEDAAASQMPVVIMVVVVAIVIEGLLSTVVAPVADS